VIGAVWLLLTAGCGRADRDACAYVRDLARSDGSLGLTRREHGVGWGNAECLQCHQTWNTHQMDCLRAVDVDLEAIRDVADFHDATTCVPCHGANGVPRLEDVGMEP
jgi:hypothetical protein